MTRTPHAVIEVAFMVGAFAIFVGTTAEITPAEVTPILVAKKTHTHSAKVDVVTPRSTMDLSIFSQKAST